MLLYILMHRMSLKLDKVWAYVAANLLWMAASILYCLDVKNSRATLNTMVQLYVFLLIAYEYFKLRKNAFIEVAEAIFCGAVFMSFFAINEYGISGLLLAFVEQERLGTEINQINVFGMVSGYGTIMGIYLYLKKKSLLYIIATLLTGFMALISASTKALLIVIVGVIAIFYTIIRKYKIMIVPISIAYFFVGSYFIANSSEFGAFNRLQQTINIVTGSGVENNSTLIRLYMTQFGFAKFLQSPLWGYGIDSFQTLFGRQTGWFVYAHNNFIEMLVSGGIIGFCTYYSIYYYFYKFIKARNLDGRFVLTIFFLFFGLGMASVNYSSKETVIFMLLFLTYILRVRRGIEQKIERSL